MASGPTETLINGLSGAGDADLGALAGMVGEFRFDRVQDRPSQPFLIACATAWVLLRASSFFCALPR
jgi:hypothetical protein